MAIVEIKNPETGEFITSYYLEDRLKKVLDTKVLVGLQKKDKDYVLAVDGKEGSGKSTFALQIAKYVDPTFNLKRIVFSPDDFRDAILNAKKGQAIVYDEAFTGFSSRSSLSPVNRVLVSLSMQMRQKNLFILIVLPTIFLLDKYMALFRTKAVLHVYENKGRRGYFRVYNYKKKKLLILGGSKTMTYNVKGLYTNFKGKFHGKFALGSDELEQKYREMKEKALADSEKTSMSSAQVKFKEQRDLMIWLFRKYTKLGYKEIENILFDYDFSMSFQQIGKICGKFGELATDMDKSEENALKDPPNEQKEGVSKEIVVNSVNNGLL